MWIKHCNRCPGVYRKMLDRKVHWNSRERRRGRGEEVRTGEKRTEEERRGEESRAEKRRAGQGRGVGEGSSMGEV